MSDGLPTPDAAQQAVDVVAREGEAALYPYVLKHVCKELTGGDYWPDRWKVADLCCDARRIASEERAAERIAALAEDAISDDPDVRRQAQFKQHMAAMESQYARHIEWPTEAAQSRIAVRLASDLRAAGWDAGVGSTTELRGWSGRVQVLTVELRGRMSERAGKARRWLAIAAVIALGAAWALASC